MEEKTTQDYHENIDNTAGDTKVIHDAEILGDKDRAKEDAMHFGHLSPEELLQEKKLKRKIDSVIMPMVVMVRVLRRNL